MSIPKCGSRFGHKFVARYSSKPVLNPDSSVSVIALLENREIRTYERDVCVRCGATVERPDPTTTNRG